MSEHQEKVYYQTDNWRNEELPRKRRLFSAVGNTLFCGVVGFLGIFSLMLSVPLVIVNFTYNLLKTLVSLSLTWLLGKCMICLFTLIVSALLIKVGIISEQVGTTILDTVNNFLFTAHGNLLVQVLPHFEVEVWLIFILSVLLAAGDTYSSLSDIKNGK